MFTFSQGGDGDNGDGDAGMPDIHVRNEQASDDIDDAPVRADNAGESNDSGKFYLLMYHNLRMPYMYLCI